MLIPENAIKSTRTQWKRKYSGFSDSLPLFYPGDAPVNTATCGLFLIACFNPIAATSAAGAAFYRIILLMGLDES